MLASGGRSAQPSPPGRLSPHLANGNTNTRKRSFSSLNSSPSASHYASHGISHHHNNNNHLRNLTGNSDATRFASQFLQASPFVGFEFDASSPAIVIETMSQDDMPDLTEEGLPLQPLIKELFTLFFDKWHSMLPCLYKKRILSEIAPGGPLTRPNTLTFAILALAGYLHPNPGVKYASHKWAALGKECFDHAVLGGKFTMQAVQGGIYLCLRMFGLAQMSEMWMFLGMVWRMCLPLGFHQIDSSLPAQLRGFIPEPRNELELEERRRTVWAVYILDRLTGISVPWTMCVVDSEFCVNFPVSEEIFQNGSMEACTPKIRYSPRC